MTRSIFSLLIIILIIVAVFYFYHHPSPSSSNNNASGAISQTTIGNRTKTGSCQVNGPLQDSQCTPGAIDTLLTKDTLCSSTFSTKSVRNVPSQEKKQVYSEYGIASHQPGQYEVDHLISLELGGSNEIANLWPEAAEPRPGFHEKDRFENYVHDQVCSGRLSLQEAQKEISTDWVYYWTQAGKP